MEKTGRKTKEKLGGVLISKNYYCVCIVLACYENAAPTIVTITCTLFHAWLLQNKNQHAIIRKLDRDEHAADFIAFKNRFIFSISRRTFSLPARYGLRRPVEGPVPLGLAALEGVADGGRARAAGLLGRKRREERERRLGLSKLRRKIAVFRNSLQNQVLCSVDCK